MHLIARALYEESQVRIGTLNPSVLAILLTAVAIVAFGFNDFAFSGGASDSDGVVQAHSKSACKREYKTIIQSANRFGLNGACNSIQVRDWDTAPLAPDWPTYGLWTRKDR